MMLISKKVLTKWNSRTKKYYTELGYEYTKMGDEFYIAVEHAKKYSKANIIVECDYCKNKFQTTINDRNHTLSRTISKSDTCSNKKCINLKIIDSNLIKYGTEHHITSEEVLRKSKQTLLNNYGVDNPFSSDIVRDKIKNTNLTKYNVEHYTQTEEYKERVKVSNMKKYGYDNPAKNPLIREKIRLKLSGSNSYMWKGGITKLNTKLRSSVEYREWRTKVYSKDNYTCLKCNVKGGKLNAHHIINFSKNEELRFEVSNGVSLCENCHISFHKLYGRENNNMEQLHNFFNNG